MFHASVVHGMIDTGVSSIPDGDEAIGFIDYFFDMVYFIDEEVMVSFSFLDEKRRDIEFISPVDGGFIDIGAWNGGKDTGDLEAGFEDGILDLLSGGIAESEDERFHESTPSRMDWSCDLRSSMWTP